MATATKEVRTVMYTVVNGAVVRHKLPFDANDPIGRLKLQKFKERGFTFDHPTLQVKTGTPEVIVTQVVDLEKPVQGDAEIPDDASKAVFTVPTELYGVPIKVDETTEIPAPVKKWVNMNATERKAYREAKKNA